MKYLNLQEKDEFIYQEARRLTSATFQSIAYQEYLPLVLGPDLMQEFDLTIEQEKRSHYDQNIDPTIGHEFSSFAYRLYFTK